jgi:hypothetical protein
MSKTRVSKQIEAVVEQKVAEAIAPSTVPGNQQTVAPVTAAVMEEVGPRIDQLTGQTPIWQSQTFWGLVFLIATRELALRGYALPDEMRGQVLDLVISYGPYACAAFIAWGRWFAKKPLFNTFYNRWKQ